MLAKNESQMDRAIRLVVGLVLLIVGYQLDGWLRIVLWVLAIVALITAATGFCWLYKILGKNTANSEIKPVEAVTKADDLSSEALAKEGPKTMPAVEPETESSELRQPADMEDKSSNEETMEEETEDPEITEEAPEEIEETETEEETPEVETTPTNDSVESKEEVK